MTEPRRIRLLVPPNTTTAQQLTAPNVLMRAWFRYEADPSISTRLEFVTEVGDADAGMLPGHWSSYTGDRRLEVPSRMAAITAEAGLPLIVFGREDLEPKVPFRNAVLFHTGPTRDLRRAHKHVFAVPAVARPEVEELGTLGPFDLPLRREKPVLGFCGHARFREPRDQLRLAAAVLARKSRSLQRSNRRLRAPLSRSMPHARGGLLRLLEASNEIDTDFVVRRHHLSVVASADDKARMRDEFVQNLIHSDYQFCFRGMGNFTVRFYEVLSAGRVPLHIASNDILPFDFAVDWRKHIVSVDVSEASSAATAIRAHYDSLSDDERAVLLQANRCLWEDRLTMRGFFEHFHEFLDQVRPDFGR